MKAAFLPNPDYIREVLMEISLSSSEVLARFDRACLNVKTIGAPADCRKYHLSENTVVAANHEDRLVYAQYGNGVQVRRYSDSVLVRSADGTHWYGDCKGRWFRLD